MNGKAKSNSVITHALRGEGKIAFTVINVGEFVLDTSLVSETCRERAMLHGFVQRISDAAAISRDPETGLPASPELKFARMQRLAEHYESGAEEWTIRSGGGATGGGLLFQSLMRLFPEKGAEAIRARLEKLDKREQAALLNSPAVKVHADAIRAEAGKGIDTEELLAGF